MRADIRLRFRGLLIALPLLLLCSCAVIDPMPPEVSLQNLQLGNLSISHATMMATMQIYNPNEVPVTVEEMRYSFSLNNVQVADSRIFRPIRLEAGGTTEGEVRLSTSYLRLLQLMASMREGTELNYRLDGATKVGGWKVIDRTFPFKEEGVIPLEYLKGK